MHGFNVVSTVLCTFMTLLDLHHANSIIKRHNQESSHNRSIVDSSVPNKPLCTSNADCPAAQGETCVSGICFCNRFGWIHEPHHLYSHCYQYICKLHEDCRTNFGQGSYCSITGSPSSHNYCTCATEIDHVTQICTNPIHQIYNSTCTHNSTCAQQYGQQSHCQYRTCVCKEKFRFSKLAQKCVRIDENVNAKDLPEKVASVIGLVSLLFIGVFCLCFAKLYKDHDETRNALNGREPEQNLQQSAIALYRARQAQLRASNSRTRATPLNPVISRQNQNSFQNQNPSHTRDNNHNLNPRNTTESNSSRHLQNHFAPLKPKPKSLDPPPNYVDALFDSTKVELNLHSPKDDDEDPYILNPPQEAPPLYESVTVEK